MDAQNPHADDLSAIERRLAGWQPAGEGLDADAMLFAAGRASVRPGIGRFAWPALAGALAVVAAILGVWLASERSERLALVQQLRRQVPSPAPVPTPPAFSPVEQPAPSAYLTLRQRLDRGLDPWSESALTKAGSPPAHPGPAPPVLKAWRTDAIPDP